MKMENATQPGTNGVHDRTATLNHAETLAPHPRSKDHTVAGKFAPGNQAGRGNPNFRRSAAWHAALTHTLDEDKLAALGARMYEAAMQGDMAAAKLLLAYVIGRPATVVEVELHANPPRRLSVMEKLIQITQQLQARESDAPSGN
jgi:hypothetical protein